MNLVVITPPTVEPVSAARAFFELKLSTDPTADPVGQPQYAEITAAIKTSREQCEQITRRAFVQQTLRLDRGPLCSDDCYSGWVEIEIPRPPLISVSAVRYFDLNNALQTIDPSSYFTVSSLVSRLQFLTGYSMPSTYLRNDALQVEYVAGYAPIAGSPVDYVTNIPESIKSAILLGVRLIIDKLTPAEREATENARDALLSSERVWSF